MIIKRTWLVGAEMILCLWMVFTLSDCTSKRTEIVHPEKERLPDETRVDHALNMKASHPEALPQLAFLDSLRLVTSIGEDADVNSTYFYDRDPDHIEKDPDGRLYFLQKHTNSIVVYDRTGTYLYSIGRGGRGPGEFTSLISFAFDETFQTLYALDWMNLEIFERVDGRFRYKKTLPQIFRASYDLCVLGDYLFISGYKTSDKDTVTYESNYHRRYMGKVTPPITRFNLNTLEPEISFGFEYQTVFGYGWQEGVLSQMMLSCNPKSNTVVGYQKNFSYIFGYDREGKTKWISRIGGLKFTEFTEFFDPEVGVAGLMHYTQKGRFYYKHPVPTFHLQEYELLQAERTGPVQNPANFDPNLIIKTPTFKTVLVNTKNGQLSYSDAYPEIKLLKDHTYITALKDTHTFEFSFYVYEY